jgi:hypothetical protein
LGETRTPRTTLVRGVSHFREFAVRDGALGKQMKARKITILHVDFP